jgi:5-methylthioadenosine/S-adenosylhomocysteine deaminase
MIGLFRQPVGASCMSVFPLLKRAVDAPCLSRRRLLRGALASASLGSGLFTSVNAQGTRALVFTHTTIVTNDPDWTEYRDFALAVENGRIAAIGPTDTVLAQFPGAETYDGRGKALLPGLINCHAHLTATLERGFNEDFGFPNSYTLPVSVRSLISSEENGLMAVIGALESIRAGVTTVVQNSGGIGPYAGELAKTGLRWVFAESVRDRANGNGPMSPATLAASEVPVYSAQLRDEGMQRIADLHASWHGFQDGRISVFPAAALAEDASPELMNAVRAFAESHDLNYTVHLNQSIAEVDFMLRYHGLRPTEFLHKHEFLGPRLFAAHCRYMSDNEIALIGSTRSMVTHQAAMAGNRGVNPPITQLRAAGATIAQGTDNNNNDMLTVMRTAMLLERIARNDDVPGLIPQPEQMLQDAAMGGAMAVRQASEIGSLEVGKKADLIVLDAMKPHMTPGGRVLSTWIHNGHGSDVESMMVDGEFIMRDRRILTVDEAALVAEADKVSQRVWGRILESGPLVLPRERI